MPVDLGRFHSLKLVALHEVTPINVAGLPEGCRIYVRQPHAGQSFQEPASRVIGATIGYRPEQSGAQLLQEGKLEHARELTLVPACHARWCCWLGCMSMQAVKNLTTLRVVCPLYGFDRVGYDSNGRIGITLPASMQLSSLTLVAPVVKLGFQDPRSSAAWLTDMKIVSAVFEYVIIYSATGRFSYDTCQGWPNLQEEFARHLRAGLSLATCEVEQGPFNAGQQALHCVYIRKDGEAEKLPAELLRNRCLCHACFDCLQMDGKLPIRRG